MMDANEQALGKYLDKQDKQEKALENCKAFLSTRLQALHKDMIEIMSIASDFNDFDFTTEIEDEIRELVDQI